MRRLLLAIAVAMTFLVAPAAGSASAHGPKTWWAIAYPFGSSPSEAMTWTQVRGERRSVDLGVGATSVYQLRSFRWSGWGTAKATGRGRVRYCDDTCLPWRQAKVVLGAPRDIDCFDGLGAGSDEHRVYLTTTIRGFEYQDDGTVLRATSDALRC